MITKSLLLIATVFLFKISFAQPPLKQWDARFGGSVFDNLYDLQQTTDGGYILGGESVSPVSGDKTQPIQGFFDFWMVKTDGDGIKQWDANFGGSQDEHLRSLTQTSDGGYLLGGYSVSEISGDKTQGIQGGYDYWVVKTDANGIKQWDYRYGGDDADQLESIRQTSDGGYILGGESSSTKSGDKSQGKRGKSDYWIVKIDVNGSKQWDARFGGSDFEFLHSVIQTNDGGYLLGGYSLSNASGDKTQNSQGLNDYWIVKTDANGIKEWDARFGGSNDELLYAIGQTTDGGYILGGYSISGISGDKTQASQGEGDYWIVKTDANGVKQWDARFGGDRFDGLFDLQQTSDGGFILGGQSDSGISGDKTQNRQGKNDYWLVKTDGNGTQLWDAVFGGTDEDILYALQQTNDGGFVLGGYSKSGISGDKTQASQGISDYWIVKVAPETSGICDVPLELFTSAIAASSAITHWNAVAAANKYKVHYRVDGTTNWTPISASSNSKKLSGLLPSTIYEWQVRSVCNVSSLGISDWSPSQNFTTSPLRAEEVSALKLDIFPNPVSDFTTLQFSLANASAIIIELLDLQGRKIKTIVEGNFEAGDHEVIFKIENTGSRVYFLQLKTKNCAEIKKIIVQ